MDVTCNLCTKLQEINSVVERLNSFRSDIDIHHTRWYEDAVELAKTLQAEPQIPRICGKQRHRSNVPFTDPSNYYSRTISIPFLEMLTAEMKSRFTSAENIHPLLLLVPAAIVSPIFRHNSDLWVSKMEPAFKLYSDELPKPSLLKEQLMIWNNYWWSKESNGEAIPDSINKTLVTSMKMQLTNIITLLTIANSLPVTSCEAERSFSKLKLLKSSLRSMMLHERLNSLAVIAIHRDLPIPTQQIVRRFLNNHNIM